MCGVWCVVCGVWCVVCGVWCVVCGVSIIYMLYGQSKSTITPTFSLLALSDNKHCHGLEVLSLPSYLSCPSQSQSVPQSPN